MIEDITNRINLVNNIVSFFGSIIEFIQKYTFIEVILPTNIYDVISYEKNKNTFLGRFNIVLLHLIILLIIILGTLIGIKTVDTVKYFTGKGLNEQFTFGSTLSPINY